MDEKKYRGGAHAAGKRVSPKKEKPQKAAEPGEPKPKRKGLGALCAAGILLAAALLIGLAPVVIGQPFDGWRFGLLTALAAVLAGIGVVQRFRGREKPSKNE